jgi:hypothetical protein
MTPRLVTFRPFEYNWAEGTAIFSGPGGLVAQTMSERQARAIAAVMNVKFEVEDVWA